MNERIEEQVSQDDTIADILEAAYWVGYNDAAMRYGQEDSIGRARSMEEDVVAVVVEAMRKPETVEAVLDAVEEATGYHEDGVARAAIDAILAAIGATEGEGT